MRMLLALSILFSQPILGDVDQALQTIIDGHAKEISQIIGSTVASCADKLVTNEGDISLASNAFLRISEGIGMVLSEKLITLAMKKDYPNACHVLSSEILQSAEDGEEEESVCINWLMGAGKGPCVQKEKRRFPVFTYYWPKYFIEVSEKGNDPHQAFASANLLYSANRKLANSLSVFQDLQGPFSLLGKVVLAAEGIKSLTGVNMTPGEGELSLAMGSTVLVPFEKMRIRANQSSDMPSFEANIWPAGLSQTMAENLSICRKGGYEWKLSGVPMTCPIAMARDAWSYWDTGLLDYLNPNAIKAMAISSNPAACFSDQLTRTLLDEQTGTSSPLGNGQDKKDELVGNLPSTYKGIGFCSFPILGDAESISSQAVGLVKGKQTPSCTIWGPIFPRSSTLLYKNDYNFANSALKFKLLAHDLFGVPSGKSERWTQAYPWEESISNELLGLFGELDSFLKNLNVNLPVLKNKLPSGRSLSLFAPGDPRLVDTSFNISSIVTELGMNFAKELAYLAALNESSSQAEKEVLRVFRKEHGIQDHTTESVLSEQNRELSRVLEETARLGKEPVFEKRIYCHIEGEKQGFLTRKEAEIEIPSRGRHFFERASHPDQCHTERDGKCVDRHPVSNRCRRPESIYYDSIEKWEIVRYETKQNPKIFKIEPAICHYHSGKTRNTHHHHYKCKEQLRFVGNEDTREQLVRPDPKDTKTSVHGSDKSAQEAATAARVLPWVSAELARAKLEEILGRSMLPGKKRVYTIFEKISCRASDELGNPIYRTRIGPMWRWERCEAAVTYEIRKYFQTKLLREVCDTVFQDTLGKPFK